LLLAAWKWLAAEADDLGEKHQCAETMLSLNPSDERLWLAWQWVLQEQTAHSTRPAACSNEMCPLYAVSFGGIMGWKRRWPERRPRPTVRPLSNEEREQIMDVFRKGIESSQVLSSLGIRVRALRGRFYFERVWQISDEQSEVEVIGRATPLENAEESLLLEVEKQKGSWYEVVRGTAEKVISKIASDTKGTFHGLGALDASLRKAGGDAKRLEVKVLESFRFVYAGTGEECPFHEALFHFFGIPIDIIAEPRQWYIYHRKPQIVEMSEDRTQVLVRFSAHGIYGSFSGVCLYAIVDGKWDAFTIKPDQSGDVATAIAWLKKREWREWY